MKKFDPEKTRQILLGDTGILFDLSSDLEKAREAGGLYGHAQAFATSAINCYLVGLDEPAHQLLAKAKQWLNVAFETKEQPRRFEETAEKFRLELSVVVGWLLNGVHDEAKLLAWVTEANNYFLQNPDRLLTVDLSLETVNFVDAEAYQDLLELIRRSGRKSSNPGASGVKSELEMGRQIAIARLGEQHDEETIETALPRFLRKNVPEWLGHGHALRAAHWAKIAFWRKGKVGITPKASLLVYKDYV